MRNQLPLRYQNFAAWQNDTPEYLTFMGWSVHLSVHLVMPAHSFCERYSVNYTLLEQSQVFQTQMVPGMGGDTTDVDSMVDLWMGSGPKVIWSEHNCPTGKAKGFPIEAL